MLTPVVPIDRIPTALFGPARHSTPTIRQTAHETASILHFIEYTFLDNTTFGLDDERADYYEDVFNYSQKPTKFTKIPEPSDYQACMSVQNPGPRSTTSA